MSSLPTYAPGGRSTHHDVFWQQEAARQRRFRPPKAGATGKSPARNLTPPCALHRYDRAGRLVESVAPAGRRWAVRLESLMVMAPIEDGARRLGLDASELFEDVSKIVGHPATVNLMMWLSRKEDDRSLTSMGFVSGRLYGATTRR